METFICTKCGEPKTIDQFGKDRGGRRKNCKVCDRERRTRYARKIGTLPRDTYLAALAKYQQEKEEQKRVEAAIKAARPKKTDDPATWKAYRRKHHDKTRGTWRWFLRQRWSAINQRTVNGSNPKWDREVSSRYLRRGIELRMTYEEFRDWCYTKREEIEQMYRNNEVPSIDRKDSNGHYEINNLQVIPFLENCRKDATKK